MYALQELYHPNIIRTYGVNHQKNEIMLEYAEGGPIDKAYPGND